MKVLQLKQLIYISKEIALFSKSQVDALVSSSQQKNKALKITGYLYYENGYFLQYLESYNHKSIDLLMNTLIGDRRHTIINVIMNMSNRTRRFSDWSMRCIQKQQLTDISMEGKLIDCMESLANKASLSSPEEMKMWYAMDVIANHKKYFEVE